MFQTVGVPLRIVACAVAGRRVVVACGGPSNRQVRVFDHATGNVLAEYGDLGGGRRDRAGRSRSSPSGDQARSTTST